MRRADLYGALSIEMEAKQLIEETGNAAVRSR
jgi:hypothetical protein